MNRRILIALIARADLDDARNLYAAKPGVETGHILDGASQMHLSVLQALGGTERDHYEMVERAIFAKPEQTENKESPGCDIPECTEPVIWVCRCSRCESEGNDHANRFYVCSSVEHKTRAEARHYRMRDRHCQWDTTRT